MEPVLFEATDADSNRLALLSHELRTPLGVITTVLQSLKRNTGDLSLEKQHDLIQLATFEADRLVRLIDDIVLIAQLDAEEIPITLKESDVGNLVAAAVKATDISKPPGRQVTYEITGNTSAKIDADRLRQVIDNLLENAIKHSSGSIHIEVLGDSGSIKIQISDTGAGIPKDQHDAVFRKFHQTEPNASGSGIGLWLCRSIITRMGGTISIANTTETGSCFLIKLPVAAS